MSLSDTDSPDGGSTTPALLARGRRQPIRTRSDAVKMALFAMLALSCTINMYQYAKQPQQQQSESTLMDSSRLQVAADSAPRPREVAESLSPVSFAQLDHRLADIRRTYEQSVSGRAYDNAPTCSGARQPLRMAQEMTDIGTVLSVCDFHGDPTAAAAAAPWDESNSDLQVLRAAGEDVSCYPSRPQNLHAVVGHPADLYAMRPSNQGVPLHWPQGSEDDNVMHVIPRVLVVVDATAHQMGVFCRDQWVASPWSCTMDDHVDALQPQDIVTHDMAVLLSERWGNAPYHFQTEVLPRVATMIPFLLAHPDVRLQVHGFDENEGRYMLGMLNVVGLSSSRVVPGAVHARVLLIPESVHCGNPYALQMDFLRRAVWLGLDVRAAEAERLGRPMRADEVTPSKPLMQAYRRVSHFDANKQGERAFADPAHVQLLFVYRKNRDRGIVEVEEFLSALRTQLQPGVNVSLFDDNGRGFHPEAWPLFRATDIVVAPHGSALAHQVAMRINSAIVEVANEDFNGCFVKSSIKLGLRHHLLVHEQRSGQLHVRVPEAIAVIKQVIQDALDDHSNILP